MNARCDNKVVQTYNGMPVYGAVARPASRSPWLNAAGRYQARLEDQAVDLRLDANEGSLLPSVLKALDRLDPASVSRYGSLRDLEAALSGRWDIAPGRLVCTAGADDAIARICASRLAPGAKFVVYKPAFAMFSAYGLSRGAEPVEIDWQEGQGFPLERSLELVERCPSLGLVCLSSPANPTGEAAPRDDVLRLAQACARRGVAFLFDGAYAEFADDDPSGAVQAEGGYVVRTFSKAYGLAGLRIGYAIAPTSRDADLLRVAGSPYPTSPLASTLALASLADRPGLEQSVALARAERESLAGVLKSLGARVSKSQGNFVFARVRDPRGLTRGLYANGIAVRSFSEPWLADSVRISCPGNGAFLDRLERALKGLGEFI